MYNEGRTIIQQRKSKVNPETLILRSVRTYLRYRGWYVMRMHQGLGAHRGLSDLICLKDGQCLFVEIKLPRGYLSEYQKIFKQDVEEQGFTYLVIRSLEEIIKFIEKN